MGLCGRSNTSVLPPRGLFGETRPKALSVSAAALSRGLVEWRSHSCFGGRKIASAAPVHLLQLAA
jgi:hypothetical protein